MSGDKAAIKAKYVILDPSDPLEVPNNSIFVDQANSSRLSVKDVNGNTSEIESSSGNDPFLKTMVAGESFNANVPLAKRKSDGKVVAADSDDMDRQVLIGNAEQESVGDSSLVRVRLIGPNLPGALTGKGFAAGDTIYVGEDKEYINDISLLTGDNDSIIEVGIADCSGGIASTVATDLIFNKKEISME